MKNLAMMGGLWLDEAFGPPVGTVPGPGAAEAPLVIRGYLVDRDDGSTLLWLAARAPSPDLTIPAVAE